jgi:xylan 1,4-beta-xylosidase
MPRPTSPLHAAVIFLLATPLLLRGAETNAPAAPEAPFPVSIQVDASKSQGPLHSIWRYFGADEPNYAYMKDGQKLLGELGQLGGEQVYFRAHHLLTSGDGSFALKWGSTSAYKEDAAGHPVYDWSINDRIFNSYIARGVKPYVQIGFMPEALSTHPENYPHNPPVKLKAPNDAGQAYPPKDYVKWGELSYQWAKHCVEEYGAAEVEKWYWEVWNEPNINYWHGTHQDYFKLYDYAIAGVRRALPTARVGGPETAGGPGGSFLREFLEHCARETNYATGLIGSPLDFISFHAKGSPSFTNNHVRMGLRSQLRNINDACAVVSAFPQYKQTPLIVGESDPDSCAACTAAQYGYRNGLLYASYTAASFAREPELADQHGVNLEGALTWAFEFEDQPLFAGFRTLATGGVDLPVLNVFRMFNQMSGQRIASTSDHSVPLDTLLGRGVRETPDVAAFATLDAHRLCVLVWHYHDDDIPGPDAAVSLELNALPIAAGPATLRHYRIDEKHSDAFALWQQMGRPAQPTPEQYAQLEAAGQLAQLAAPADITIKNNKAGVSFLLPRQGVSLLVLEWRNP